ncbi:MAG: hypothetical protein M3Q29_05545 [Chloroflexota bacterium]|nr:hypothetical protein [Chloroflexota bacterium]
MKLMSERLGHATAAFTQDVSMHAIPALEEAAAKQVADLVFGDEEAGESQPRREQENGLSFDTRGRTQEGGPGGQGGPPWPTLIPIASLAQRPELRLVDRPDASLVGRHTRPDRDAEDPAGTTGGSSPAVHVSDTVGQTQNAAMTGHELVGDLQGESLDTHLLEIDDSTSEPLPNLGVTNQ